MSEKTSPIAAEPNSGSNKGIQIVITQDIPRRYHGPVVIEAFTPKIKEIARAVSIWCPLAESEDALASNGLRHLKAAFAMTAG